MIPAGAHKPVSPGGGPRFTLPSGNRGVGRGGVVPRVGFCASSGLASTASMIKFTIRSIPLNISHKKAQETQNTFVNLVRFCGYYSFSIRRSRFSLGTNTGWFKPSVRIMLHRPSELMSSKVTSTTASFSSTATTALREEVEEYATVESFLIRACDRSGFAGASSLRG